MHIYNPVSYRWERDPKGKYAYGATCVKECPEHLLKDNGACVRSCPEKFRVSEIFLFSLHWHRYSEVIGEGQQGGQFVVRLNPN